MFSGCRLNAEALNLFCQNLTMLNIESHTIVSRSFGRVDDLARFGISTAFPRSLGCQLIASLATCPSNSLYKALMTCKHASRMFRPFLVLSDMFDMFIFS